MDRALGWWLLHLRDYVMDRPPIVQYWHAAEPPRYIASAIDSFVALNPERGHLVFSRSTAAELIAERFGARHLRAFEDCAVPAMQADYFRYCATFAFGGLYSDAYWRCTASLEPLFPGARGGTLFQAESGAVINGLFAFGSPRHPFLELTIEIATANIEHRISQNVYFVTGPPIFSTLWSLRGLGSFDALFDRIDELPDEVRSAVRRYCEVIGDYERVCRATTGMAAKPLASRADFMQAEPPDGERIPHWTSASGNIFAPSDGA